MYKDKLYTNIPMFKYQSQFLLKKQYILKMAKIVKNVKFNLINKAIIIKYVRIFCKNGNCLVLKVINEDNLN